METLTNEKGAHCVIAHENPVIVIMTDAPVTVVVILKGENASLNSLCQHENTKWTYKVANIHPAKIK